MNNGEWLKQTTKKLEAVGITTARLDGLVLLEDATGKDRGWLLAHPEIAIKDSVLSSLSRQIKRRAKHEPLAYIRGKSEFYGREFIVSKDTLEPRPETETMIELALREVRGSRFEVRDKTLRILDVGTGCGAIAITMKLEIPNAIIHATDISERCLNIAEQNANILGAGVDFYRGDLLQPIDNLEPITYNLILANLPYVPDTHTINRAAMQEPKIAIFGGPDGLDLYRRMFRQIIKLKKKPAYIFTESLPFQHAALAEAANEHSYKLASAMDFIQCFQKKA